MRDEVAAVSRWGRTYHVRGPNDASLLTKQWRSHRDFFFFAQVPTDHRGNLAASRPQRLAPPSPPPSPPFFARCWRELAAAASPAGADHRRLEQEMSLRLPLVVVASLLLLLAAWCAPSLASGAPTPTASFYDRVSPLALSHQGNGVFTTLGMVFSFQVQTGFITQLWGHKAPGFATPNFQSKLSIWSVKANPREGGTLLGSCLANAVDGWYSCDLVPPVTVDYAQHYMVSARLYQKRAYAYVSWYPKLGPVTFVGSDVSGSSSDVFPNDGFMNSGAWATTTLLLVDVTLAYTLPESKPWSVFPYLSIPWVGKAVSRLDLAVQAIGNTITFDVAGHVKKLCLFANATFSASTLTIELIGQAGSSKSCRIGWFISPGWYSCELSTPYRVESASGSQRQYRLSVEPDLPSVNDLRYFLPVGSGPFGVGVGAVDGWVRWKSDDWQGALLRAFVDVEFLGQLDNCSRILIAVRHNAYLHCLFLFSPQRNVRWPSQRRTSRSVPRSLRHRPRTLSTDFLRRWYIRSRTPTPSGFASSPCH